MSDLISRQAAETLFRNARKALMEQSRKEHIKDFNTRDLMLLNAEQLIHLLPSVEPERKTGKWIRGEAYPHRIYCSECYKTFIPNDEMRAWVDGDLPRKYCPECGARMEVADDT